ncbi:MAG: restriction endonuclease subunit S [Planctomycetes bacterium]|nr:restriction endonuclease subunit S [Planctomycetota bacterium]
MRPLQDVLLDDAPGFWGDVSNGTDDIAVLRSTNLRNDGRLDFSDIAKRAFPEKKRVQKRLEVGDILLERSGGGPQQPVGRVALFEANGDFAYSNFIQRLRPDAKQVLPRFLFYALWDLHARGETSRLQQATTGIRNLQYNDYLARPQLVPPLAEQRKIAAILSSVDEKIEKTEAVIAQLDVVKKAMLEELLTRGIPGRHSRFKQSEIGEVPQEWRIEALERVVEVLDSKRKPLNSTERQTMQGPFPYYGANGPVDSISEWIFDEPLLLMAEDGGYFDEFATRPIAYLVDGKCWVNNHAHVLRVKEPNVREWVFYSLVHRDIRGFINSATRSKLNQADLRRIPVPLPSPSEQAEMASALLSSDAYRAALLKELKELRSVKSSLSTSLLSGEVRVGTGDA